MAKIFKCKGIPYYITGCSDKLTASVVAIKNRWRVTPGDLVEVESIDDAIKAINTCISKDSNMVKKYRKNLLPLKLFSGMARICQRLTILWVEPLRTKELPL